MWRLGEVRSDVLEVSTDTELGFYTMSLLAPHHSISTTEVLNTPCICILFVIFTE